MTTYLTIITTALVATQVIRVIQNTIQLHRDGERIKSDVSWIKNHYPSERDFEIQREVFRMLHERLTNEGFSGEGTEEKEI